MSRLEGDYAYLAAWHSLVALDVSDATTPELVADRPVLSNADRLAVGDGFAHVGGGENLWTVDVSDPTGPALVGSRTFTREVQALALTRVKAVGYLLVAEGGLSGQSVRRWPLGGGRDRSRAPHSGRPYQPAEGYGVSVAATADIAYLAARDAGLRGARPCASRPAAHDRRLPAAGFAMDVAVQGDFVYLADRGGGLYIVDVSSPRLPTQAGVVSAAGRVLERGTRRGLCIPGRPHLRLACVGRHRADCPPRGWCARRDYRWQH